MPEWGLASGVLSILTTSTRWSFMPSRPDSSERASGTGVGEVDGEFAAGVDGRLAVPVGALPPPLQAASARTAVAPAEASTTIRRRVRRRGPAEGRPGTATP